MNQMSTAIPFLVGFLLLLATAGILVPLMQRLRLNPVLGYLLAGLLLGPHGLALLLPDMPWLQLDGHEVHVLAELGVIFLLFILGLELSPATLWQLRHYVLGLGTLQMLLTGSLIGLIAYSFGNSWQASVLLGGAMAMSSTAIVMQLLSQRHALAQPVGQVSFSILLLQDLAVAPLLILTAALSSGKSPLVLLAEMGPGLALLLGAIIVLRFLLLRPLLRLASYAHGEEAFLAIILLMAVGFAALAGHAGLSMSLGAFIAGVLLAETEFRHAVEVYITPFKGLLLGIFFMSVGMSLDVREVYNLSGWLIASLIGLVAIKAATITLLGRLFRLPGPLALESGLMLAQSGEFAFVIIGMATVAGLMPAGIGQFMLILTALSLFLTPLLARIASHAGQKLRGHETGELHTGWPAEQSGHVILIGYGRVGRLVGEILSAENIPWVAVDSDSIVVAAARKLNLPVWYGDGHHKSLLEKLSISSARGVVVTAHTAEMVERILALLQQHWPKVAVSARVRDRSQARRLLANYRFEAAPENLALALQLAASTLRQLQVGEDAIHQRLELARTTAFK